MSLKDLFNEDSNLKNLEPLTQTEIAEEIESYGLTDAVKEKNARFVPNENFSQPEGFARFGSAQKYYDDTIRRIYDTYPYDGSLKEKVLWELSSSYLDLYILENGYPRTTGYANFVISPGTTDGTGPDGDLNFFSSSGEAEYILAKGGPHPGTGKNLYWDAQQKKTVYRKDANVYDLSENRENNLKIGGTDGNTAEFWLKKDAFVPGQDYFECVLDAHVTGTVKGDAAYGRFFVFLATEDTVNNSNDQPFLVGYGSGSTESTTYLGSDITATSLADGKWHHYAVRTKTTGSDTVFDLFVDGQHNDRYIESGDTIDYVSGAIVATFGAQAAPIDIDGTGYGLRGWSKLSGSLDEVRYWKTWRTSQKLGRYWFSQVGGGTNTDPANTDLGVYYKFNEGITQTASIDSIALDYSGRISNGTWVGYSTTASRNTGSAIVQSSASFAEFKDPIIYSTNPDVINYITLKNREGRIYDDTNVNSLDSMVPAWMLQENETSNDELEKNQLMNALQIIASYFDQASIMIEKLPELKQIKYYTSGSFPPPFNKHALESHGFMVPDLFINADLLEQFEDRSDDLRFEQTLQQIKNVIYQNIYNNLIYINKSKGTEKAFRNLLRCFGIGDNVIKFNMYANNQTYRLQDNTRTASKVKSYANFNEITTGDATVYQYQADSNATSYISGTQVADDTIGGLAFTLEGNFILPNRVRIDEYSTVKEGFSGSFANLYPLVISSSLLGTHTANGTENDLTWDSDDYANFQVYTIKDDRFSSNAYFLLTGSSGGFVPHLSSSWFQDIYDDQLWTVAVSIKPKAYPMATQVSGASDNGYTVQFYGSTHISDLKRSEFLVTGSMTETEGRNFMASHKRVYTGAHKTNFTGSTLQFADTKATEIKAWYSDLPTGTIDQHNMKTDAYGDASPTKNAFLYQTGINSINVPDGGTLALRWNFDKVSASNANGQFFVEDASSGSADDRRYGWFSGMVSRRHTASGSNFDAYSSKAVQKVERTTLQQQVPEVLLDSNLVRIMNAGDDDLFSRDTRPITYHFSLEKNLFQDISEEMLNMFASITYLNTLLGAGPNRYRPQYKELIKAAEQFFEKVDNDYDFDKYVHYFRHIDHVVNMYVQKLIPASLETFRDGISTVIENFVLGDRNKYQSKAPIVKEKIPEFQGQILGINELLYDWEYGHAPFNADIDDFKAEKSIAFNATTAESQLTIADANSLSFGADGTTANEPAFSFTAWIKPTNFTNRFTIINKRGNTIAEYIFYIQNDSKMHFDVFDGAFNTYIGQESDDAISAGSWIHVAGTYDASRAASGVKLYVNGALIDSTAETGGSYTAMENTAENVAMGRLFAGATDNVSLGQINEVAAFDKALSATEVAEIYNSGRTLNLNNSSVSADIVSWWRMGDKATGTPPNYTIPDQVGSNNATMASFQGTATSGLVFDAPNSDAVVAGAARNQHCLWWNQRANRSTPAISSGISAVDTDRQSILNIDINETNAPDYTLAVSGTNVQYSGSTYAIRHLAKPYRIKSSEAKTYHGGTNFNHNRRIGYWSNGFRPNLKLNPYVTINDVISSASCDDKLDPNKKVFRSYSFDAQDVRGNVASPFNIVSASADTRETVGIWGSTNGNQITNIHYDTYGDAAETPMQGPFTETHVGGQQRRHVPLNSGSDNVNNRPELFRISATPGSDVSFIFASDQQNDGDLNVNLPRANYYRDETAKRPINVRNIQTTTGSTHNPTRGILGNYYKDYEIVLTNGRNINNVYLTEAGSITASSVEVPISGVFDFPLPERGRESWVIVNRFSAPGGPEVNGVGFMDIEGAEYSVYNALPWRNLTVRKPLLQLESDHSKQFGYFSDAFNSASYVLAGETYPGTSGSVNAGSYYAGGAYQDATASFQKINRNRLRMLQASGSGIAKGTWSNKSSSYDNAFVQRQIPRTDLQYAWITASVVANYTGSALFGYEQKNFARADYASSDITFCSSSDVTSYLTSGYRFGFDDKNHTAQTPLIATPFVGINYHIVDYISASENTIGYPTAYKVGGVTSVPTNYNNATFLNQWDGLTPVNRLLQVLISHRGGPYGGANWKLYRKDNHPIVRYQRNNNLIGYIQGAGSTSPGSVFNFVEPPVTSKYKPLRFRGGLSSDSVTAMLMTYGNQSALWTDHSQDFRKFQLTAGQTIDQLLTEHDIYNNVLKTKSYSPYLAYKAYALENNIKNLTQVSYTEIIYPKGQFTYLSGSRKRLSYVNDFWRDSRSNRIRLDAENSNEHPIQTSSMWPLDPHLEFKTSASYIPYVGTGSISSGEHQQYGNHWTFQDGAGELQNSYSLFHFGDGESSIHSACNYNRRIPLVALNQLSLAVSPAGITTIFSSSGYMTRAPIPAWSGFTSLPYTAADSPSGQGGYAFAYSGAVGDTLWEASGSGNSGTLPFYDSYDKYAEDGFRIAKDGTIIPEFRISERIAKYNTETGVLAELNTYDEKKLFGINFTQPQLGLNTGLLSLTGALQPSGSGDEGTVSDFLNRHAFSDFYEHFQIIDADYTNQSYVDWTNGEMTALPCSFKIGCEAIVKFLPYKGFYPADRTLQLGALFSSSLSHLTFGDSPQPSLRTAMQPYFAPGILYNSIKAGIAVDYPVFTEAGQLSVVVEDNGSDKDANDNPWYASIYPRLLSGSSATKGRYNQRLGFEKLIDPGPQTIYDSDPFKDTHLNSTASWLGLHGIYQFAMSNFLAETMNTFLLKGRPTQLASPPLLDTVTTPLSQPYYMDVILRNSTNLATISQFNAASASNISDAAGTPNCSLSSDINTPAITMYSRATTGYTIDPYLYGSSFGPPCSAGTGSQTTEMGSGRTQERMLNAFDPYTPPYYNGYAYTRIGATMADGAQETEHVIGSLTSSRHHRLTTFHNDAPSDPANSSPHRWSQRNAMQVTASLNCLPDQSYYLNYNPDGTVAARKYIISPKWECPILDFANAVPSPSAVTGTIAKGMWHQYGEEIKGNGVVMEVRAPDASEEDNHGALSDVLGFTNHARRFLNTRLGDPATRRTFSEAIVVVPFKTTAHLKKTYLYEYSDDADIKGVRDLFYKGTGTGAQIVDYDKLPSLTAKQAAGAGHDPNIYELLRLMHKYVLPPHMDFLHNTELTPFAMYIMEFEKDLYKKDLMNIWQNIEPTFARKLVKATSNVVSHPLATTTAQLNEMRKKGTPYIDGIFDPETTRWAVFKVKRRARNNYYNIVNRHNAGEGVEYIKEGTQSWQLHDYAYSFNWPHDFYSLIELGKITTSTTFNPLWETLQYSTALMTAAEAVLKAIMAGGIAPAAGALLGNKD